MSKINNDYDEELDYFNQKDMHNKFRGKIEFKTLWCAKLANILCKDEEMVQKYLSEYYNPEFEQYEVINSLQHLRRDIFSKRTDVSEYTDKIKSCIETENWKWLRILLQELFLEFLVWEQVEDIVELIHSGVDENDIMKWYKKGRKILKMTTFKVDYIKGI